MNTDAEWEKWGKKDPYFGVLSNDKFRNQNLTRETKIEFFESGRNHIKHVIEVSRRHLDKNFSPKRALDFGCGTGRLIIPLAEIAEHVVGIDVSESMLNEALKNCNEYSAKNVSLLKSDDSLSFLDGSFNFIHSYIVFQHIPVKRGMRIFANLLTHLEEGGVCIVHFTYSKVIFGKNYGEPPAESQIKKSLARVKGFMQRLGSKDPEMQMNPYNINKLLFVIQSAGVQNIHIEFTDHDGELGILLFFQKSEKK